jgi:hypothetical protein
MTTLVAKVAGCMWQVTSGNDDLLPATCDLPPDEPIICVNPENLRPKPKSANIVLFNQAEMRPKFVLF